MSDLGSAAFAHYTDEQFEADARRLIKSFEERRAELLIHVQTLSACAGDVSIILENGVSRIRKIDGYGHVRTVSDLPTVDGYDEWLGSIDWKESEEESNGMWILKAMVASTGPLEKAWPALSRALIELKAEAKVCLPPPEPSWSAATYHGFVAERHLNQWNVLDRVLRVYLKPFSKDLNNIKYSLQSDIARVNGTLRAIFKASNEDVRTGILEQLWKEALGYSKNATAESSCFAKKMGEIQGLLKAHLTDQLLSVIPTCQDCVAKFEKTVKN